LSYVTDLKKYGVLSPQGNYAPVYLYEYICMDCFDAGRPPKMQTRFVLTKCRRCGSKNIKQIIIS